MAARTYSNPYTLRTHGRPRTSDFRVFIEKDGCPISPFHDIPLYADEDHHLFNMVVEIPRWTNEKYEVRVVCSRARTNPIAQRRILSLSQSHILHTVRNANDAGFNALYLGLKKQNSEPDPPRSTRRCPKVCSEPISAPRLHMELRCSTSGSHRTATRSSWSLY